MADYQKDVPVLLQEPDVGSVAEVQVAETKTEISAMKCPIDNIDLVISSRDGVEIDYCPQCRGVWLDRGELDKIIERSGHLGTPQRPAPEAPRETHRKPDRYESRSRRRDDDDGDDDDDYRDRDGRPYRKKRQSFLKDIFDF